jgi:hypothetical protein
VLSKKISASAAIAIITINATELSKDSPPSLHCYTHFSQRLSPPSAGLFALVILSEHE